MTPTRPRHLLPMTLAALSGGAGVAHLSVIVEHVAVAWWYGAGFALVAVAQIAWAPLLLRRPPGKGLLLAGAAGHGAVLATWALARTAGLPFVPTGSSSAVGLLDGTAALFEGLVVAGVLVAVTEAVRLRPRAERGVAVASLLVLLLAAPVTVAALAAGPGHTHEAGDHSGHAGDHAHAGEAVDEHTEPAAPVAASPAATPEPDAAPALPPDPPDHEHAPGAPRDHTH